ncbi:hypothetical protein RHGRI_017927 [Rhododendron griersonianum]|uniref:Cellulose synthase-like protein H1 n=1 Tax=Rhododendron griersonianum TaxID=479676 RepID=A0AAV6JZL2_9ERIC|nr:hypothetical protein RHGRI_017927 [Rhododendron griersonianum]
MLKYLHFVRKLELPPVDMFVTTADPVLEPPILTVNTVLSLLALDYPADKLACYVSDDGGSPLTFYSLVEASKFAKLRVPFCKKYSIPVRAPFRYFSGDSMSSQDTSPQFQQDWKKMKDEYEQLSQKIEDAAKGSIPCELIGEFADFMNIQRRNHASIVKVIWENKEAGDANGVVPHLVYISREKRPKHPHHFKAGAMNILTRVSGVMTNAPFMLNVDCDMYVNNPQIVLHALCLLLGVKSDKDCAFVQFPQHFYDGLKDDPYGSQWAVLHEYLGRGLAGIQGPFYGGTGCFHRRKVIYGLSPYEYDEEISGKLSDQNLQKTFGSSMEFTKSGAQILSGSKSTSSSPHNLLRSVEAANQVATCVYEYGTAWGREMGWIYGSTTEDILTGLTIHGRGWKSTSCTPTLPGFLGCAPSGGPATMTQHKRWATGLLEILVTRRSPLILTLVGKLQFRQCLAYLWILLWGLRSVPELCYATLPAYCIISGSRFLPKCYPEAPRNTETVFGVTQKEKSPTNSSDDDNANVGMVGRITFNESPIFISATMVLLVHQTGLVWNFKVQTGGSRWACLEYESGALALLFVHLSRWSSMVQGFGDETRTHEINVLLREGVSGRDSNPTGYAGLTTELVLNMGE